MHIGAKKCHFMTKPLKATRSKDGHLDNFIYHYDKVNLVGRKFYKLATRYSNYRSFCFMLANSNLFGSNNCSFLGLFFFFFFFLHNVSTFSIGATIDSGTKPHGFFNRVLH